jgi:hypothetical protein
MDFAPLINAFRNIGGWHSLGVALALSPLAFAVFLGGWAPSGVEFSLAIALAGAAGFTLGSLFHWLAGIALPRWQAARARAAEDTALVKQLTYIGSKEKAVLGAFFATGRRECSIDITHADVRDLIERKLLIQTRKNYHRIPDAIWSAIEKRPEDFPPGSIPSPGPNSWMLW